MQMTSPDKDFRFMATNDLMSELRKDSIKLDDDSERKVLSLVPSIPHLPFLTSCMHSLELPCQKVLAWPTDKSFVFVFKNQQNPFSQQPISVTSFINLSDRFGPSSWIPSNSYNECNFSSILSLDNYDPHIIFWKLKEKS